MSCTFEQASTPKPHSYPRINFEPHEYITFNENYCPVTFEYPLRSQINKNNFFFNENTDHECWFNLGIHNLDATLFFTYHPIVNRETLELLVDDAFTLVSKHNTKANSREESRINNAEGLKGVLFLIGGKVASPLQFYLTDEKKHFIRASLYYNQKPANDSLLIVTEYIKNDVLHIISTTKFL